MHHSNVMNYSFVNIFKEAWFIFIFLQLEIYWNVICRPTKSITYYLLNIENIKVRELINTPTFWKHLAEEPTNMNDL